MKKIFSLLKKELYLSYIKEGTSFNIALLYILLLILFPLGITSDVQVLKEFGVGIMWISSCLSILLSFERWLQVDYENGSLHTMILQSLPLEIVILTKIIAHWLTTSLIIILLTPLVFFIYNLDFKIFLLVVEVMIYSTSSISLFASLGACLTIGLRQKGILLSILLIPLYIPLFIFSILTIKYFLLEMNYVLPLKILKLIFITLLISIPWINAIIIYDNITQ